MGFGRNPHVARAEAAELKARSAKDSLAGKQGWLEAARQWERAGEREKDEKRKQAHLARAEAARSQADLDFDPDVETGTPDEPGVAQESAAEVDEAPPSGPGSTPRSWLN